MNNTKVTSLANSRDGGISWRELGTLPSRSSDRVSIAVDDEGIVHVVWTEGNGESSQIYYSNFTSGKWSIPVRLSDGRWYSGYPSLAIDSEGELHVVWYGFDGSNYQVFYTRTVGLRWAEPIKLTQGRFDSVNPSISTDSFGRVHVVWYMKKTPTFYQVWYREYNGTWLEPEPISLSPYDSTNPSIAVSSDGIVHVVWIRDISGSTQVFYSKRTEQGWSKEQQLSDFGPAENPSISINREDNPVAVWNTLNGSIYYRVFDKGWGVVQKLKSEGINSFPNTRWSYFPNTQRDYLDITWVRITDKNTSQIFARINLSEGRKDFNFVVILISIVILIFSLFIIAKFKIFSRNKVLLSLS
jgi:hypothetical protein